MKKQLDFTPATHQINELLYPVSLLPIYAVSDVGHNKRFTNETKRHKAIVNKNTNEIVSVVSNNYKLLPNKEAIERGKEAFHSLFSNVNMDELIPFKVIAPGSLASCHIDFIHRDVQLSHRDWEQDSWFPFLRVSNSYNRSVAFKLEIGFVRELCSNGVILKKDSFELKYHHDKMYNSSFSSNISRLKQLETSFVMHLNRLKKIQVDSKIIFAVVCNVLNLKFDINNQQPNIREREKLRQLRAKAIIEELTSGYFAEMENTAYAVINVLSDFVSHQSEYKCIPGFPINPNAYYQKVGEWMQLTNLDSMGRY